jgi:IS4 transposase
MLLNPIFQTFVEKSPLSVMARATIANMLPASFLDEFFNTTAETGYTRSLLFSTTFDLMSLVVCGKAPHLQSAYNQIRDRVPVSLKCVYEKLQRLESGISSSMVENTANRCADVIQALGCPIESLLPGYRVRILDGNHLAGTQKRLKVTRGLKGAVLPGQCLAVLDPSLMLITNLIACEDGHTQERALIPQVLPLVQAKDVWIADRNFCTCDFLTDLANKDAFFVIRRHGNMTLEPQSEYTQEVETETGWVSERKVWVVREGQRLLEVRQIRVRLKQPTKEKETEIEILSNLPEEVKAVKIAQLYRDRWKVEGAFYELTMNLNCELKTLGYPKAALFGFAVAVVAYNILAVIKAAIKSVHGKKAEEVSGYYVGLELAMMYAGMMIVLPEEDWSIFEKMSVEELAKYLLEWAAKINLEKCKKSKPRKPTKKKTVTREDPAPHHSTARLIQAEKQRAKQKSGK